MVITQALPDIRTRCRNLEASGAENAAVPRLDVLSLPLHRLWIALYELDGGKRPPPCLLLHQAMERAQAGGIDQTLLRLDAEKEALEQACRVGTGRGFKDGARSDDERRALAGIDDFDRRTRSRNSRSSERAPSACTALSPLASRFGGSRDDCTCTTFCWASLSK